MDADAANARRCGGHTGAYEAWYVTVNDPSTRRGYWIRYTTFQPSAAAGEPHAALWAFAFDRDEPSRNWGARQVFPLSSFRSTTVPFAVGIGGTEMTCDGCRGDLRGERGAARWDLRWDSRRPPFPFLDPRFQGLSSVANIGAQPALTVSGVIEIDGRAHRLDGAPGGQQHTWGSSHALEWNWGFASGADFWVDGVSSRIRSRLGRELGGTAVGAEIGGEVFHFNGVLKVLRNRGPISPDHWAATARLADRRLTVSVTPRREDLVGVTYQDPRGGHRYCYHTEVADLDLSLTRRDREPILLARAAAAAFEYASEEPLPGVPITV